MTHGNVIEQLRINFLPQDALCAQTDPEIFFPEKGGSSKSAKDVCISCPIQNECLQYALKANEHFGIWGGKSERERRALRIEHKSKVLQASRFGLEMSEIATSLDLRHDYIEKLLNERSAA